MPINPTENAMASPMTALKQPNEPANPALISGQLSLMPNHALAIGTGPPARLDTVIGANHKEVLVTITERSSNYLLMNRLPNKSAQEVRNAITASLRESGLPVHILTSDNGTEFADYEGIASDLKASFCFAHPYHA